MKIEIPRLKLNLSSGMSLTIHKKHRINETRPRLFGGTFSSARLITLRIYIFHSVYVELKLLSQSRNPIVNFQLLRSELSPHPILTQSD